ncbi:hypothetical protein EVAR_43950_1 [Eumeta japonica]|uniref:Uncharacterized protein n=1 Tax=Eumeta variegata TaxID=151549 RepID=A0A4C1Y254_EUMVA|nr:hypothetical protein EVAR_43950_1 [Eumeta japonica]
MLAVEAISPRFAAGIGIGMKFGKVTGMSQDGFSYQKGDNLVKFQIEIEDGNVQKCLETVQTARLESRLESAYEFMMVDGARATATSDVSAVTRGAGAGGWLHFVNGDDS